LFVIKHLKLLFQDLFFNLFLNNNHLQPFVTCLINHKKEM
jgi:hypothetical protein